MPLTPFLRSLLLACLLGVCLQANARPEADLPTATDIKQSLDSLADSNLPEPEVNNLRGVLESTLLNLEQINATEQQAQTLETRLKTAPQVIRNAKAELIKLEGQPETPDLNQHANESLDQLEALLGKYSTELAQSQRALTEANSIFINAQSRPELAPADVNKMLARHQQIEAALTAGKENGKPISKEVRTQLLTEQALIELKAGLLKDQMSSNDILLDLGTVLRDLETRRSQLLDQQMLELQTLISEKRRQSSEKVIEKFALEATRATPDSLLAKESKANLKLSTDMLEIIDQLSRVNQLSLQLNQQLDSVKQTRKSLDENISVLKGSVLLARILYQQKKSLDDIRVDRGLVEQIADIRLRQFEVSQQREALANPQLYLQQLLDQAPGEAVSPGTLDRLHQHVKARTALLAEYSKELNALLNSSIRLQLTQTYLLSSTTELNDILEEQMFWVPSNKPLTFSGLLKIPPQVAKQVGKFEFGQGFKDFFNAFIAKPWIFIPALVLILVLIWQRKRLKGKLSSLNKDIGHFKRDSQMHTPLALLFNLLLALPVSLLLALAGFALQMHGQGQNLYFADAMFKISQGWLVLYTAYCLLKPGGMAERHFHWPREITFTLYSQMRSLGLLLIPLLALATVAENQPEALSKDNMGMLLVMFGFLVLAFQLWRLLLTGRQHASMVQVVLGAVLAVLPLALVVAISMGYYYTALKLTDRLIDTLYVVMIWITLEAVLMRGMSVAARRLAYNRAVSKREQIAKEGGEGGDFIEEPKLDIEQVSEQSMRLIRLALFGVLALTLYWVWADLLTVFSYLDNFTLYEYSSGTGAAATMVPLSLGDMLGALLIVALTVALASNLPGLLEVLVLSRMKLAQGSSYAVTTLLTYVIVGFGTVVTLSVLGLSWDKLQWLVAALSLGIGFGMQEIFANFISGLIILFERPVRIGDTVTIGPLSGTVSRIQIRATTITDFDRKEIIVPNKSFITDQLINWSLTDTVTRLVLTIGLAYEADLTLARKLVMQLLHDNPLVLRDPEPQMFFTNIGASTFNYDIRFHVKELADRLPATDEVLTAIALQFREHNVEMAFNQMDIFVKNMKGQEAQLESKQVNLPPATPKDQAPATDV